MIFIPGKIADFTDEVAKSRIKIFQLWRKLLAFTFMFIRKNTLYFGYGALISEQTCCSFFSFFFCLFLKISVLSTGCFFMNPKVNANNFLHNWNIFILLFVTSSVKSAILPGIKNIILPWFLKTQSSFFKLLSFSPHKHDIKKNTQWNCTIQYPVSLFSW